MWILRNYVLKMSTEAKFLANFIVLVTNVSVVQSANSADICATYVDDDPPIDGWISLNCNSSGRFVTIKRGGGFRQDAISFCEVSVTSENSSEGESTQSSLIIGATFNHDFDMIKFIIIANVTIYSYK